MLNTNFKLIHKITLDIPVDFLIFFLCINNLKTLV